MGRVVPWIKDTSVQLKTLKTGQVVNWIKDAGENDGAGENSEKLGRVVNWINHARVWVKTLKTGQGRALNARREGAG